MQSNDPQRNVFQDKLPLVYTLLLLIALFTIPTMLSAGTSCGAPDLCGNNCPAVPAPQCCTAAAPCLDNLTSSCPVNGELWPAGFHPVLPGQVLNSNRDSTDYRSFTFPGAGSGHELFRSVDVVGNRLFVAYNAGIQAWNLSGNPENPNLAGYKDGYQGGFRTFPPGGESDSYIEDIDALDPTGAGDLVAAMAAINPVGLTLWSFDPTNTSNPFALLFQHDAMASTQVRLIEDAGRVYALAASGSQGVQVYDVTAAQALPSACLYPAEPCPGVSLGRLGGPTALFGAKFLDVFKRSGEWYLAVSDGAPAFPLKTEIWAVDPTDLTGSGTVEKYSGGNSTTHGLAFFLWSGNYYLGQVNAGTTPRKIEILDVGNCLDANGCTSAPLSSYGSFNLPTHLLPNQHFLTYSSSEGFPFLYHGGDHSQPEGPALEHLLDLSNTGSIENITGGGGTYTEACHGASGVDYWGHYNATNEHGLRNVAGHIGKFYGERFYRAARGVLDIHIRSDAVAVPATFVTANDSPPYWFEVPISFSATANNCTGAEDWEWLATNNNATGLGFGTGNATQDITWDLCGSGACPNEAITISAKKQACSSDPNLIINGDTITLQDPRPVVAQIDINPGGGGSNEFPLCTELTFSAAVEGRPGFTYLWEVKDSQGQPVEVLPNNQATLVWDTGTLSTPEIFADGFETGDTLAWGAPVPSLDFDVSVVATNLHGVSAPEEVAISLTTAPAAFLDPAFTVVDLGSGAFRVTAETSNATEFRFEIEDPENGSPTGCLFYADCVIVDWNDDPELGYQWTPPNPNGNYGVTAQIRGCNTSIPPEAEVILVVEPADPAPPMVDVFDIDLGASPSCQCVLGNCFCDVNTLVRFTVDTTGDPETLLIDWDGDDIFEETVPFGTNVGHTFTSTGPQNCQIKAVKGAQESPVRQLDQTLTILTP